MNPPTLPLRAIGKPAWLQKIQWLLDPLRLLDEAACCHGDLFQAAVPSNQPINVVVGHPQALQQLLTRSSQFVAPPFPLLQPIVGDGSLFLMVGDRHRRERKLLMPPFHGERMPVYGRTIVMLVEEKMRSLPVGTTFVARDLIQSITLEVILKVVFGVYEASRFDRFKKAILQLFNALQIPWISPAVYVPALRKDWGPRSPWGYLRSIVQQMDEGIYAEIRDRRQHPDASKVDILNLLIAARDEAGEGLSDEELRDELITLLLAGYETTAHSLSWAVYWTLRYPAVCEKLVAELDGFGPDAEPMAATKIPYLDAVCNEVLRICPTAPVTFPREVKEPTELMGYRLEAGAWAFGCIYLIHQRSDIYPEPKAFRPERFLERQFSPYEFLPFGGGTRRCLGEALAMFELKLVLATLLSGYRLRLASSRPVIPKRRGVTIAPADGVKVILQEKLRK